MGTRADFYIGRGLESEWIGSIAWDGYPEGIDDAVKAATTPDDFRSALNEFFKDRTDVTLPEHGWPWPWGDSRTTDYAYAIDDGKVWASCFGHRWFIATGPAPDDDMDDGKVAEFPNMEDRKNVATGDRSGTIIIGL
jgi:hypothetical protein